MSTEMTNDECGMTNGKVDRVWRGLSGEYRIVITGPKGLSLDAVIDLAKREKPKSLRLDDEAMEETMVVADLCAGCVEGELTKRFGRKGTQV